MNFNKDAISTENGTIEFWDTKNTSSKVLVLLAPGASTGEVFTNIKLSNYPNVRFIAPSFPGRGSSTYTINNLPQLLVCTSLVSRLLKELQIESVDILGISFGTMIVSHFLEDKTNTKVNHCVLIAPGEYFNPYQRLLLKVLFLPTRWLFFQKIYYFLLRYFLPSLKETRLSIVRAQWMETIKYQIDTSNISSLPITAYTCKKDNIVSTSSKKKLTQKYQDIREISVNSVHPLKQKIITELVDLAVKNLYS